MLPAGCRRRPLSTQKQVHKSFPRSSTSREAYPFLRNLGLKSNLFLRKTPLRGLFGQIVPISAAYLFLRNDPMRITTTQRVPISASAAPSRSPARVPVSACCWRSYRSFHENARSYHAISIKASTHFQRIRSQQTTGNPYLFLRRQSVYVLARCRRNLAPYTWCVPDSAYFSAREAYPFLRDLEKVHHVECPETLLVPVSA